MSLENSSINAQVTVAALNVEKAIGGTAGGITGLVVQPVAWYITGTAPDAADAFIYGSGFAGLAGGACLASTIILAAPGIVAGGVKAGMDDYVGSLVAEVRQSEPEAVRSGIVGADEWGFWAANNSTTAMRIAGKGGVAWKHPNGAYVYIRDNAGVPICDYQPQVYSEIYRPKIPLQRNGNGVVYTGI